MAKVGLTSGLHSTEPGADDHAAFSLQALHGQAAHVAGHGQAGILESELGAKHGHAVLGVHRFFMHNVQAVLHQGDVRGWKVPARMERVMAGELLGHRLRVKTLGPDVFEERPLTNAAAGDGSEAGDDDAVLHISS
jgi:hypothetical protein